MTVAPDTLNGYDATKWHRLSPVAVVYFIFKFISGLIKNATQSLAPLVAVLVTAGENRWLILGLIVGGVSILIITISILRYLRFRYRITETAFLVQRGVVFKKNTTLNFDRIQNVNFKEPFYFRPFGLVSMEVESAGSSSEEVSLAGIKRHVAERLRDIVLKKTSTQQAAKDHEQEYPQPQATDTDTLISLPLSELIKYGLCDNRIWVFLAFLSSFVPQMNIEEPPFMQALDIYFEELMGTGLLAITVFTVTIVAGIILLVLFMSVLGAVIGYYRYRLTFSNGRFHATKGLFNRHETSLKETKIQSIQLSQPWQGILFKRWMLTLRQIKFGKRGGNPSGGGTSELLIPSVTEEFADDLTHRIYPNATTLKSKLSPIDKNFILKRLGFIFFPIGLVLSLFMFFISNSFYGFSFLIIPILALPFVILRYRKYGYATDGEMGLFQSGFFGRRQTIFPFYKVQNVVVTQSPGQKRRGLANIRINMAGYKIRIPYIKLKDANQWRDQILYKIESHTAAWM